MMENLSKEDIIRKQYNAEDPDFSISINETTGLVLLMTRDREDDFPGLSWKMYNPLKVQVVRIK